MAEKRLYDAAVKGDVKSLLDLLKEDPLILDRVSFTCYNKTPLHIATICQHTAFVQEIVQRNPLLAAELDSHQSSSLHIASAKGYAEIAKAIVSAAPDNDDGDTILHLAVRTKHFETVQYLMETTGIDMNAKNANGYTALDILEQTPTDLKDTNNYLSIKKCLMSKACNSINSQTQPIKCVMSILLLGNTVRLVDRWLQKRGITVWRPRRFRD
ncbi:unnamed protein product [Fraxinus pennsylvanica]|uniref:Uncharacterized protein n=1 Tax=Fraxinus pennsylvanica TaxID=56036 RepID=A0AAD2AGV1_9LAMI|nr:unnamed protein product [Fraxinus pennsylvanica]